MGNKSIGVIAIVFVLSSVVYGMENKQFEKVMEQVRDKKFDSVEKFLQTNEQALRKDPEYYVILLNYSLAKGDQSGVLVAKGKPKEGDFALSDPKTGEQVGLLGYREGYDDKVILDGIQRTNDALVFFKSRLDIRFGIIEAAEKIKRWDILGDQCVGVLKVSKEIDNKWAWGAINSLEGDPKEFMLENVQSRTSTLFRQDTPETDAAMIRVSQAMIDYYPDVIYGYSNLGVLYLAKKDYDKADQYFQKASKINPNGEVVKGNIDLLNKARKK